MNASDLFTLKDYFGFLALFVFVFFCGAFALRSVFYQQGRLDAMHEMDERRRNINRGILTERELLQRGGKQP